MSLEMQKIVEWLSIIAAAICVIAGASVFMALATCVSRCGGG